VLSLVTFGIHTILLKQTLTLEQAVLVLSLMNTLSSTLNILEVNLTQIIKAGVSYGRIIAFLEEDDIQDLQFKENQDILGFQDASLTYRMGSSEEANEEQALGFCLRKLTAQFVPNKLNVIVGPTAAGKSSLVMALLGGAFFN